MSSEQTAAQRITAFLDAWDVWRKDTTPPLDLVAFGPSDEHPDLERSDLRAVLADNERVTALLADFYRTPIGSANKQLRQDLAETRTKLAAALAETDQLFLLINDLTDEGECWFDHHGGCQAHGYLDLKPGEKCPHQEAKELLAERDEPPAADDGDGRDGREGAWEGRERDGGPSASPPASEAEIEP
jgi:hypothetical protein